VDEGISEKKVIFKYNYTGFSEIFRLHCVIPMAWTLHYWFNVSQSRQSLPNYLWADFLWSISTALKSNVNL